MDHRVAAIQMCSTADVDINLQQAKHFIQQAAAAGAKLIVLPENFALMSTEASEKLKNKELFGKGKIQDFLSALAKQHNVWIIGGTIPIAVPDDNTKIYAASLVFNSDGKCIACYHKIHLFDIALLAKQEIHYESQTFAPGETIVVVDTPLGKCGIAVCYDLRFPELFRAMAAKNAEIIVLPAAFTVPTGVAHWEVLLRARAIENQVYIIAAAQEGTHANQRKTYGHSMIVNPWGEVVALQEHETGIVCADLHMDFLHQLRAELPVLKHRKI